ncbi:branched-chain amino acid ABC transporter permease [Rhizobium sp. KAs_5_22]|nr:branched-chain amino acid ABC transporter permease [Rhizobium sp. KAs_5_22]
MMMRLTTKQTTLLVLALLIAATPFFFPSAFYFRVGSLLFVNGVAVLGIVILTGFAGQISLGHAGFAGIGAYASALAPVHLGLHPAFAAVLGAALSAAIAYVVGRPILRLKGYYLAVASLGFGILVSMVLSNEAWLTGGPDGIAVADLGLRQALGALGLKLSAPEFWYFFCGFCLLVGAWLALNLYDSPTGRALRALHGSEIAASTVGVDVPRLKLQAFVISAVYASVSGSLLALQNKFITPDVAGYMHSIELVTMAVLGGAGSVLGAILGAGILTLLPQVLTVFAEYEQVMLGLVMMLVMIFLREGLLPSLLRQFTGRGA